MANKQTREQLGVQEGDQIILRGVVAFARLDKLVEGKALEEENARRSQRGMLHTKPFRSISIENPEIVQGEDTPLAKFHGQEVYQSKTTNKPTMSFESKSLFAPSFGHIQEDGSIQEMQDPQKNPAQGQVVYLMIKAFKVKGYSNLGSTFDAVVYEKGNINFYEGKGNSLAGFGKAMNMPVQNIQNGGAAPQQPQENVQQEQQQPVGAGVGAGAGQGGFGGGFNQAPAGDPNQPQQNQGGFGQGQPQDQGQGGFGQMNPQQNGDGQNPNPFGVQDGAFSGQGSSPFNNNGQRGQSPYA